MMAKYKYVDSSGKEVKKNVYLMDIYAVKILRDERNRDYLLKIVSAALGIDYDSLVRDFELVDIRLDISTKTIASEADVVLQTGEIFINVEVNSIYKNGITDNKNLSYVCALILRQLPKGSSKESYRQLKKIYQICLNGYDRFKKGKFIYRSKLCEVETKEIRSELINIFDINLDFLSNIDYTNIKKYEKDSLEWLLYIFVCNDKAILNEVYVGDLIMEKIKSQLYDLDENIDNYLFYDKEKYEEEVAYAIGEEKGIEKGIEQGIKQGIEQSQKEIIQKLFTKGFTIDEIHVMLDISLETIQKTLAEEPK